jgi:NAD(P)H dehydrogenase (quinone)
MKIGIILYSSTGHTRTVAYRLVSSLSNNGHQVEIVPLEPDSEMNFTVEHVELKRIPDVSKFNALVLASPVIGDHINAPMASFLEASPPLEGKKIILMATHFFPHAWGCRQMFRAMRTHHALIGSEVIGQGDVIWLGFNRRRRTDKMVEHLTSLI